MVTQDPRCHGSSNLDLCQDARRPCLRTRTACFRPKKTKVTRKRHVAVNLCSSTPSISMRTYQYDLSFVVVRLFRLSKAWLLHDRLSESVQGPGRNRRRVQTGTAVGGKPCTILNSILLAPLDVLVSCHQSSRPSIHKRRPMTCLTATSK